MPLKRLVPVQREHTGDAAADRQQTQAGDIARFLRSVPFLYGTLKSVKFTAGPSSVVINHGLGVPAACFVVRMNYHSALNGPLFTEASQAGLDPNKQLKITASAICDVDLWVYPRASKTVPTGADQSPNA